MNEAEWKLYLAKLGRGPNIIAESLKTLGIKGIQKDPTTCPLARYILRVPLEPGKTRSVSVDTEAIEITEWTDRVVSVRFAPSKRIETFLTKFDEGEYPDLIDPNYAHDKEKKESP